MRKLKLSNLFIVDRGHHPCSEGGVLPDSREVLLLSIGPQPTVGLGDTEMDAGGVLGARVGHLGVGDEGFQGRRTTLRGDCGKTDVTAAKYGGEGALSASIWSLFLRKIT